MLCHVHCAEIFLQFFLSTVFTQMSIPRYCVTLMKWESLHAPVTLRAVV